MKKKIVLVGLGLIGGSLAKALKLSTEHEVLGVDISDETLLDACSCGAIDRKATLQDLAWASGISYPYLPSLQTGQNPWGVIGRDVCAATDAENHKNALLLWISLRRTAEKS